MKKILLLAGLIALPLLGLSPSSFAQDDAMSLVRTNYPSLYKIFKDDLSNIHANYVFAVDVSGSMRSNAPVVQPALKSFFSSLPDGDHIDIIPFGTFAKASQPGYMGEVNAGLKAQLNQTIDNLYTNPADQDIRGYTDIPDAMDKINKCLTRYSKDDINFIFILTDFRNEDTQERQIAKDDIDRIYADLAANTIGVPTKIVTLQLNYNPSWPGFCRPQLEREVFNKLDADYQTIPVTTPEALRSWFDALKKEVMVERLHTLVSQENKAVEVAVNPRITVDGKVGAEIKWNTNRLYKEIKINDINVVNAGDSTGVAENTTGFRFITDKKATDTQEETEIDLELGKLKHKSWGFHRFKDELLVDIDLPTSFDTELAQLKIEKPLPSPTVPMKKWVWTFFLPLWLTALILLALIIYIIGVIKSIGRNGAECFTGEVKIKDSLKGINVGKSTFLKNQRKSTVLIPDDVKVQGPTINDWKIEVAKIKGNIFLWGKPKFRVRLIKGASKSFTTTLHKQATWSDSVKCGPNTKSQTHLVTIDYKKSK